MKTHTLYSLYMEYIYALYSLYSLYKQARSNFLRAPYNADKPSHTMTAFLYPALQHDSKVIFHDTLSDYSSVFGDSWCLDQKSDTLNKENSVTFEITS